MYTYYTMFFHLEARQMVFSPAVAKYPSKGSNCRINAPHSHSLDERPPA